MGELTPDVLITDIRLPVIDGLELARTMREQFPDVRVVILTGFDDLRFKEAATAAGVAAYVLKSESAEKMISVLRAVVREEVNLGIREIEAWGREVGSTPPKRPDASTPSGPDPDDSSIATGPGWP